MEPRQGARVVLAPNAFKGTFSAAEACRAMGEGVERAWPGAAIEMLPMSDGGDGFVHALIAACGGGVTTHEVHGPLLELRRCQLGWTGEPLERAAVIELAASSGLSLVAHPSSVTAGSASTRGVGDLIGVALEGTASRIVIGLGGSASTDGGVGLGRALGYRFVGRDGEDLPEGGTALAKLHHIEGAAARSLFDQVEVVGACDVTNPLLGAEGAAAIYGPQKGADVATVAALEDGLCRLVEIAGRDIGTKGADLLSGAGAGGGTGFGLVAFCQARLVSGVRSVAEMCELEVCLHDASVVITGEGRFDLQSMKGKVTGEVARMARKIGIPCVVIVGSCAAEARSSLDDLGAYLIEMHPDVPARVTQNAGQLARLRKGTWSDLSRAASRACEAVARWRAGATLGGSGPY